MHVTFRVKKPEKVRNLPVPRKLMRTHLNFTNFRTPEQNKILIKDKDEYYTVVPTLKLSL